MNTNRTAASILFMLLLLLISTTVGRAQVAEGIYSIVAKHSGKCLDVSGGSNENGGVVIQYTCNRTDNQLWIVRRNHDQTYSLTAKHSGKALNVPQSSQADGTQLIQWPYGGGANERFNILPAGDGYSQILAVHSNKAVDVQGGSTGNGAAIIQYARGVQDNQRFKFVLAPVLAPATAAQSGTRDFYMIFASDPQYPWTDEDVKRSNEEFLAESERLNRNQVKSMQAIASQVGRQNLKGVVINGDLTAFGHDYQLAKYKELYDQGLGLKIYPGLGNHDYANNVNDCAENNCAIRMVTYMSDFVKGLNPISFDFRESDTYYKFPSLRKDYQGSLAYSWDLGDVHFVQLHNYPAYTRSWNGWNAGSARRDYVEITSSMNWLRADLARARNRGQVVILNMHDAANTNPPGTPPGEGDQNHFADEHPKEFAEFIKLLREFKVSAVFAGHLHNRSADTSEGYSGNGPLFISGASSKSTYLLAHFKGNELIVETVSSKDGKAERSAVNYGQNIYPLKQDRPATPIIVADAGSVTFFNQGGYVAKFSVSYIANGKSERFETGELALGNQQRYTIPGNATNIQVKGLAKTGLVWDPWNTIFDQSLSTPTSACYQSYGTTLAPKWNNACK